jgi:hypothetical protein
MTQNFELKTHVLLLLLEFGDLTFPDHYVA